MSHQVPVVMAIGNNLDHGCSLQSSQMELNISVSTNKVEDLKNDVVLNYVLNRVLHLNDVLSSVDKKCISRSFDIFNFPFSDIKRMVQVIHEQTRPPGNENSNYTGIFAEMNHDCLQRHLSAFALQLDRVPGDGNCCFTSIVKALHTQLLVNNNEGNNYNEVFAKHLQSIGLGNSIESDTAQLRLLFCQEIEKNIEKYSSFVDFDVKEELKRFSESGWFNSSLGDLCVYGCSNFLHIPIVVITSLPGSPVLTFIPSTLLSKSSIYIAFDHSFQGHYDATRGELTSSHS